MDNVLWRTSNCTSTGFHDKNDHVWLGLVGTFITMAYVLWMIKRVFFGKLPENLEKTKEANWYVTGPMMVLAGFSVVIGIYPDVFFNQIIPFMKGLVGV